MGKKENFQICCSLKTLTLIEFLTVQDTGAEEHAKQIVLLKKDLKEMQDSHNDIAGKEDIS